MNATLNISMGFLAYGDVGITSNPSVRNIDRTDSIVVPVVNPQTTAFTIAPGASLTLFNGVRSSSLANDTELALTLSPLATDRYRFTWDSTGTNPVFRTNRNLSTAGLALTIVVNANLTITVTGSSGEFTGALVGDTVFIPGVTTGDTAGPFNPLNEGYWVILGTDGSVTLQLGRPADCNCQFTAFGQTVTPSSNYQFQAYSAAGLQVGDTVNISGGFSSVVQRAYAIVAVNPIWFEVISNIALPVAATAVPTTSGIVFYTVAKRLCRIDCDQESVVQVNGDSGMTNRLSPWAAGDPTQMASYIKVGPTWSAVVLNISTVPMSCVLIAAE